MGSSIADSLRHEHRALSLQNNGLKGKIWRSRHRRQDVGVTVAWCGSSILRSGQGQTSFDSVDSWCCIFPSSFRNTRIHFTIPLGYYVPTLKLRVCIVASRMDMCPMLVKKAIPPANFLCIHKYFIAFSTSRILKFSPARHDPTILLCLWLPIVLLHAFLAMMKAHNVVVLHEVSHSVVAMCNPSPCCNCNMAGIYQAQSLHCPIVFITRLSCTKAISYSRKLQKRTSISVWL